MLDEGKLLALMADAVLIDGQALDMSVVGLVARRLGAIAPDTSYAEVRRWLVDDEASVEDFIEFAVELMAAQALHSGDVLAEDSRSWARAYYEAAGVIPSGAAETALAVGMKSATTKLKHLCSSDVLGLVDAHGHFTPFREAYLSHMDSIVRAHAMGGVDVEAEVKRAARSLAEKGLTVRYASGRRVNVASAAATTARTGIAQAVQGMRDAMGREFGADGVEVSAHSLCAPDHLPYQGRQFSNEEFERIQAGLSRPIATGPNCGHATRPVILGVSSETYSEKQRAQMREASERRIRYVDARGRERECTRYEATQLQRRVENDARKLSMLRETLRRAGVDTADVDGAVTAARAEYWRLCDSLGLKPQPERLDIYELPSRRAAVRTALSRG